MGIDLESIYALIYIGNGEVLAGAAEDPGDGDVYKSTVY